MIWVESICQHLDRGRRSHFTKRHEENSEQTGIDTLKWQSVLAAFAGNEKAAGSADTAGHTTNSILEF